MSIPVDTDVAGNNIVEGAANGTAVGLTASSTNPSGAAVTYSLNDSAGGRFAIDATTGVVTVANGGLVDFENSGASHEYTITVTANSGTLINSRAFTIGVTDVNDTAPVFTSSATPSAAENTTPVVSLATTDVDTLGNNPPAFTISGGADQALFQITGGNQLSFIGPRDFETQSHSYAVQVTANDGANSTIQNITVTLTDANDIAPVFISGATGGEAENSSTANVVYDADATDADGTAANNTVAYSLSSGGDNDLFLIDSSTGLVTFKPFPSLPPDFENPADADANNVYQITVHANDGVHDVTQNVAITVTDVQRQRAGIPVPADEHLTAIHRQHHCRKQRGIQL